MKLILLLKSKNRSYFRFLAGKIITTQKLPYISRLCPPEEHKPMKHIFIAATAASTLTLGACSFGDIATTARFMAFDNYPVVKASTQYDNKPAPTKQQVIAAGGQPKTMTPIKDNGGVCFDYDLRKDDFVQPYFVAFDAKNTVYYYGYLTCVKADSKGFLKPATPSK